MILSKEQITTLKKNLSVSKNPDLTKERVQADYKAAKREQKKAILALSGQAQNSIYRVFSTGSINARIVMAMAQTLNVEPRYYTGEVDEKQPADEGKMLQFLEDHGYADLVKELNQAPPKRKYNRKPKDEPSAIVESPAPDETIADEPQSSTSVASHVQTASIGIIGFDEDESLEMPKEEAVQLIEALYTQAKYSDDAKKKLAVLQHILVKA